MWLSLRPNPCLQFHLFPICLTLHGSYWMFQVITKNKSHIYHYFSESNYLMKVYDTAVNNLIVSDLVSGALSSPEDVTTLLPYL